MTPIHLRNLRAFVYRAPITAPVTTSFGTMRDRPCVLVCAEDRDGQVGWGEIWCNFPAVGAEHRARLIDHLFAALLTGRNLADPPEAFAFMTRQTAILALQSGEIGPINQCIAGIDVALWDLAARRAGLPLWRILGGTDPEMGTYASGLHPDEAIALATRYQREGFRAFKLKLGFGHACDLETLAALRIALGEEATLMADANQGWTLADALAIAPELDRFGLDWIEEPIRADCPSPDWQQLASVSATPLAAGENIAGDLAFDATIATGAVRILQPDCGKWGGISATLPMVRRARAAGLRYCPHWLGGGIGLLASAHLLVASGGEGVLEIDANPNPLRSTLCGSLASVRDGRVTLDETPGLGSPPDQDALAAFRVRH